MTFVLLQLLFVCKSQSRLGLGTVPYLGQYAVGHCRGLNITRTGTQHFTLLLHYGPLLLIDHRKWVVAPPAPKLFHLSFIRRDEHPSPMVLEGRQCLMDLCNLVRLKGVKVAEKIDGIALGRPGYEFTFVMRISLSIERSVGVCHPMSVTSRISLLHHTGVVLEVHNFTSSINGVVEGPYL